MELKSTHICPFPIPPLLDNNLVNQLHNDNIVINVITIQETWNIQYPEYLLLPGFQSFVFKKRAGMRGGGVGIYIKKGINFKILSDCSPFENKIIETLTLQLTYPNSKSLLVANIYRSNGPILNVSQSQQIDRFLANFDDLLRSPSGKRHESLIFTDSNLYLLKIGRYEKAATYMDSVFSHGYLQTIFKATRLQNDNFSLNDHIFTNTACTSVNTGVLITELVTISQQYFHLAPNPINVGKRQRLLAIILSKTWIPFA
jgi:hypothetical protein